MINITITGLDELKRELQQFSERRLRAAVATGLTRTAAAVRKDWRQTLSSQIDSPLPQTRNAAVSSMATAQTLTAEVKLRDQVEGAKAPPAEYLAPLELGGQRRTKKFEQALQSAGAMPTGQRAVPGPACQLDGYGNPSRAQLVAVLRQLGANLSPGYQRVISRNSGRRQAASSRAGRVYVAFPRPDGKLRAGVYERRGRGLVAVFYFVSTVQYRKQLRLMEDAMRMIPARLQQEIERAVVKSAGRLAKLGR